MTGIVPEVASSRSPDMDQFLRQLVEESHQHAALTHPWLQDMKTARFADMTSALRDFAWHYNAYSAWFQRYLTAVIGRLDRADHRSLLRENLEEEKGHLEADDFDALREVGIVPESIVGIPHSVLFRQFCTAMELGAEELANPHPEAAKWRSKFLNFLNSASPAAAVGALGLGTESIVKHIYPPILDGIRRLGTLQRQQYVFFELHCLVDEQHQLDLMQIAADVGNSPEGRRELRRGMLTALELRREFWDFLYQRAKTLGQVA